MSDALELLREIQARADAQHTWLAFLGGFGAGVAVTLLVGVTMLLSL